MEREREKRGKGGERRGREGGKKGKKKFSPKDLTKESYIESLKF